MSSERPEKHFGVGFFIWLMIRALFTPYVTILVYNWDDLGTKSASLNIHLAVRMNSENIEPLNIDDGILLDRSCIYTIKEENL